MSSIPNYLTCLSKEKGRIYLKLDTNLTGELWFLLRQKYSIKEICGKIGLSERIAYHYIENSRTPSLSVLIKVIGLLGEKKYIDSIYDKFSGIFTWGHNADILPKDYSDDLAYLTGLVCGDGHISKRTEVYIVNDSKDILERASQIIKKLFFRNVCYREMTTYGRIDIGSRPINFFMNKVIGIPKGKKKGILKVPSFIYLSDSYKINFLRGLFDSDGGVTLSKGRYSILFSSSTYSFLIELQEILKSLGIVIKGPYKSGNKKGFEIRSYSKPDMIKFSQLIGSYHPFKSKRLSALVAQSG